MPGQRSKQTTGAYYLVLNRSCADLYEEIAEAFEDRAYIEVVVDRRQGEGSMKEIPAKERRGAGTQKRLDDPRMVAVLLRKQAE
ncbi:MAG TPA: hypothetical protein VN648_16815 [Candidatus Methylomirabilis sp.]|nr:hypothetical protein [Candidatus Methylomirabilis sp.]